MAPQAMENLTTLAKSVVLDGTPVTDMGMFVNNYLDVFNRGFQYAFYGCYWCYACFADYLYGK